MIYWEDFKTGDSRELGSRSLTAEQIVSFAREYDPQPFHIDEEAAGRSIYGGLIASGWQTAAVCMRLAVDAMIEGSSSMGSPGVDELRWLKPVRPGDTLSLRMRVLESTPSRSKPDRGTVKIGYELRNQRGEMVMTMIALGLFGRRPGPVSPPKAG